MMIIIIYSVVSYRRASVGHCEDVQSVSRQSSVHLGSRM
jgi:hypothetical protein